MGTKRMKAVTATQAGDVLRKKPAAPPPIAPPPAQRAPQTKAPPAHERETVEAARSVLLGGAPMGSERDLAKLALQLRDEQVRARVVYVGAEQETNAELDAITDAVVAELQAIAAARPATSPAPGPHGAAPPAAAPAPQVERELARTLRTFLDTLLSSRRKVFLRRKLEDVQRRVTSLFFNSELGPELDAGTLDGTEATWPEQALFYALKQHIPSITADLYMLKYPDLAARDEAVAQLKRFETSLRVAFLSRTTPELERMLKIVRGALAVCLRQFRKDLGPFSEQVIREARVAALTSTEYKLPAAAFGPFRAAFEARFMALLVDSVQDAVLARVPEHRAAFRDPTLRFLLAPRLYSEVCTIICEGCYDFLYLEGFLDLPVDWRTHLGAG